jgi:hypothetical protein
VVTFNPVEGVQVKVLVPLAIKSILPPSHTAGFAGDTVIAGLLITVTTTVVDAVQPLALVPTGVYVVVTLGDAVTVAPVELFNPVDGDQVYVAAPLAVSMVALPVQINVEAGFTVITGGGIILTVAVAVSVQPALSDASTVYVVFIAGCAVFTAPVDEFKLLDGDQTKLFPPPLAVIFTDPKLQMLEDCGVSVSVKVGITFTTVVALLVQPIPSVTFTV